MNVELDGMKLIEHIRDLDTGATKELKSVYNISVSENRSIVEHKIPGMEGGILQDLGREPVRIFFDGIIYGETAREDLERIRAKYKKGTPVPFSSDVSGAAEVTQILIEGLNVRDHGGSVNRYEYSMMLREYLVPSEEEGLSIYDLFAMLQEYLVPSEEEEPAPSQEKEAEEAAEEKADDAFSELHKR